MFSVAFLAPATRDVPLARWTARRRSGRRRSKSPPTPTNVDRVDFSVDGVLAGVARKPPYRIAYDFGTSLAPRTITAKVWSNGFATSESATRDDGRAHRERHDQRRLVEVPLRVRSSRTLQRDRPARARERRRADDPRRARSSGRPRTSRSSSIARCSMGDGKLDAALRADRRASRGSCGRRHGVLVLFNHNVDRSHARSRRGASADIRSDSRRHVVARRAGVGGIEASGRTRS